MTIEERGEKRGNDRERRHGQQEVQRNAITCVGLRHGEE
jgi:hypothetical protein